MIRPLALSRVYRLLEPGPVVLVTTAQGGRPNVMTMSWHTMMDFEPPLIGCVIGSGGYTFGRLRASRECVIAIPDAGMARTVVKIGNCSGRDTDKFEKFGIPTLPASRVGAPLLPQCFANLECVATDLSLTLKYNFFVLKVVRAWIDTAYRKPRTIHHMGKGLFMVSGRTFRLPSRMK